MKRRTAWLLAGLWLVGGLGLKLARYADAPPSLEARSETAVRALMARHGWQPAASMALTTDALVQSRAFVRPGCAGTVRVAVLATGPEMASLVARQFGAGAVFLVAGELRPDAPNGATLGLAGRAALPPIAILPEPSRQDDACHAPTASEWRTLQPAS